MTYGNNNAPQEETKTERSWQEEEARRKEHRLEKIDGKEDSDV